MTMTDLEHLERYYAHLYTLSGGTLKLVPGMVSLGRTQFYQFHVHLVWNGKAYGTSLRIPVDDVRMYQTHAATMPPWRGNPVVYRLAVTLLEFLKHLQSQGCDYALPEQR